MKTELLSFRRILFPVDFSERSEQTAPYVAWIAHNYSQVILLHALDLSLVFPTALLLRQDLFESYQDSVRRERELELAAFAPGIFDGLSVTNYLGESLAESMVEVRARSVAP